MVRSCRRWVDVCKRFLIAGGGELSMGYMERTFASAVLSSASQYAVSKAERPEWGVGKPRKAWSSGVKRGLEEGSQPVAKKRASASTVDLLYACCQLVIGK